MTADVAVLNHAEQVALDECERVIESGLKKFMEVGSALAFVRQNRLYRGTNETFEAYARERWNLSRPRAYELMTAAEVVSGMPDTETPVDNARQAVELAKVPEAERADVWAETVERTNGKPTAAAVREVHEERTRPTPTPGPADAADCPPADPGTTSEHYEVAGWKGVECTCGSGAEPGGCVECDEPGSCGAECACGMVLDGYDSLTEAREQLALPHETPEPDAVTALSGPGSGEAVAPTREDGATAEPSQEPADRPSLSPTEHAAHKEELARESERRTAVASVRSVLTYLTSRVLSPGQVAQQYAQALAEFTAADLAFAAETMAALAALKER